MSEHTPGPWKWEAQDASMTILGTAENVDEGCVLWCIRCKACQSRPDALRCGMPSEADARLIAAAPDLLEACKELRTSLMLTRDNIIRESKLDAKAASRWEGVPELLLERMKKADAVIDLAEGTPDDEV